MAYFHIIEAQFELSSPGSLVPLHNTSFSGNEEIHNLYIRMNQASPLALSELHSGRSLVNQS